MTYSAMPHVDPVPSNISVHSILDNLGVLEPSHHSTVLNAPFRFEEDLDRLRGLWDDLLDAASDSRSHTAPSQPASSPGLTHASDNPSPALNERPIKTEFSPVHHSTASDYSPTPSVQSANSFSSASDLSFPATGASAAPFHPQFQGSWPPPPSEPGQTHFPPPTQPSLGWLCSDDVKMADDMDLGCTEIPPTYQNAPTTIAPSMLQAGVLRHPLMGEMSPEEFAAWRRWSRNRAK